MVARVARRLDAYVNDAGWLVPAHPDAAKMLVAYFSMEFGLDTSLPIYSGGLGILAGDHLKSASDLGLPLVGVGLLYRRATSASTSTATAGSRSATPRTTSQPAAVDQLDATRPPVEVEVAIGAGDRALGRVWRVQVGRVPLYLLDANIRGQLARGPRASPTSSTAATTSMRMRQEILLGIGGVRALRAAGHRPDGLPHERGALGLPGPGAHRGHAEETGATFAEAPRARRRRDVFTTHTPVPAGNDDFTPELVEQLLRAAHGQQLGMTREELLALGRQDPRRARASFCMTVLALRTSGRRQRRERAARRGLAAMWHDLWPELPTTRCRSTHITNGIHTRTWLQPRDARAAGPLLGPRLRRAPGRSQRLGARRPDPRRRAVARRTSGAASGWCCSPASVCATSSRARARAADGVARGRARCSTRRP